MSHSLVPLAECLRRDAASRRWMFLGWASQLLAMLNEPHGACIAALLVGLAREYPRAFYFAFQVNSWHAARSTLINS